MTTVSPLQDPAGLVDDSPKLTNLHGNDVDDDNDTKHNGGDDDEDDDDENLVHICPHPAL